MPTSTRADVGIRPYEQDNFPEISRDTPSGASEKTKEEFGMAKKEKRFEKVHQEGDFTSDTCILVDKETGVNYLFYHAGHAGGLTPLLKADGTPVVTPVPRCEE